MLQHLYREAAERRGQSAGDSVEARDVTQKTPEDGGQLCEAFEEAVCDLLPRLRC